MWERACPRSALTDVLSRASPLPQTYVAPTGFVLRQHTRLPVKSSKPLFPESLHTLEHP